MRKLYVNNDPLCLENKKKQKHKGTLIDLQQRKVYKRKPQFWSPREACYCNEVNERLLASKSIMSLDNGLHGSLQCCALAVC